jgi:hypothetical protein
MRSGCSFLAGPFAEGLTQHKAAQTMANNPFTIRSFVPDGDPEGVRIIDRMNWTGLASSFRAKSGRLPGSAESFPVPASTSFPATRARRTNSRPSISARET